MFYILARNLLIDYWRNCLSKLKIDFFEKTIYLETESHKVWDQSVEPFWNSGHFKLALVNLTWPVFNRVKREICFPDGIYLLKVNNRNTRTRCEICLTIKITIKILEQHQCLSGILFELWTYFTPCSSISIVNFEHVIAGWVIARRKIYSRKL